MQIKFTLVLTIVLFQFTQTFAQERNGATISWTGLEAEKMKTTGTVLKTKYDPFLVETESSGQQAVKLNAKGEYIEFASPLNVNSLVIRHSLPDNKEGKGTNTTLGIYLNGKLVVEQKVSSRYSMLYGNYPFSNDPSEGKPRNFYDESRIVNLNIKKGDLVKIQRNDNKTDDASFCIIDVVDIENIPAALVAPPNSLSINDISFTGSDTISDYTQAFNQCLMTAMQTGKTVWIPAGTFKISGNFYIASNVTIQGAGMWYANLVGDPNLYEYADRRIRFIGNGSNIHLSDFAITGKLTFRSDNEPNDGIVGKYGTNSTISRIWVEHTKAGVWVENSKNLTVEGCRFRNTLADGMNFCVGMTESTMKNCTARGTGDDCFAIWPATWMRQIYAPGKNLITHCTGQLPFLANGVAIYGGESNKVSHCTFTDIAAGSAVLISTTFPTESKAGPINNNFSGTTIVEYCDIKTSGGFDHGWQWRAAVQLCLDKREISGLELNHINIENSLSDALNVVAVNEGDKLGKLSNCKLNSISINKVGLGVAEKHAVWIATNATGSFTLKDSKITDIKNESKTFTIEK